MNAIALEYGPAGALVFNVIKAAIFIVLGFVVAGFASRFVKSRASRAPRVDPTLAALFSSVVYYLILVVVVIAVLQVFGFQATSLVAVLGAATLAIGFALQGSLANLAAGVMLVLFRPLKIGDFVDLSGHMGTVSDLNLFMTELTTPDNVKVVIPNGQVWDSAIVNYSAFDTRRCDITFGVDYEADIDRARQIVLDIAKADDRFLEDPAPMVSPIALGDSSVDLTFRGWTKSADLWEARWATIKRVKEAFDEAGISIPFPHRTIIQKSA